MDEKIKSKGYEKLNPGKTYKDYVIAAYGPLRAREILRKPLVSPHQAKKEKEQPPE